VGKDRKVELAEKGRAAELNEMYAATFSSGPGAKLLEIWTREVAMGMNTGTDEWSRGVFEGARRFAIQALERVEAGRKAKNV